MKTIGGHKAMYVSEGGHRGPLGGLYRVKWDNRDLIMSLKCFIGHQDWALRNHMGMNSRLFFLYLVRFYFASSSRFPS